MLEALRTLFWELNKLTFLVKVPDYNISAVKSLSTKEDERAADLARRAQQGDYDDGKEQIDSVSKFGIYRTEQSLSRSN